ncbi:MAG: radical SAM protein [Deltaproteobacteria bacterium]|nr:MAG: radical SAM protein [Deltaproteobacteria bacterium]
MGWCRKCHRELPTISNRLGYCATCIKKWFDELGPELEKLHSHSRIAYRLPSRPPKTEGGVRCKQCVQDCKIGEDEVGYCGIRRNDGGKIKGGRPHEGNLSYYHDPLPTNCVADFVCPAGTGSGFPHYAISPGPEYGYRNLAVFYHACSYNCLYCQNYHFKEFTFSSAIVTAKELAQAVDASTTCVCYFGGDPAPQVLHAIKASRLARQRTKGRILRICWETNGSMAEPYLEQMARLSIDSGGCIKFDLKAWDDKIHRALCGATNKKTLENFKRLAEYTEKRPEPPFLIASTLLVPGYVDVEEVGAIARFIAQLNPEIPYSLLGFHPHFYLDDLPRTSRSHAFRCKEAAEAAGLRRVHIGNLHLLGDAY